MENKNSNVPKKISFMDKIKAGIRKVMGYKEGTKFIIETEPVFRKFTEIELMKLAVIEEKLKDSLYKNKNNNVITEGISKKDAESLLAWVVQNARENFIAHSNISLKEESLLGFCGFGQGITAITLENMGLFPNLLNANPTFSNQAGRHAFLTVEIPIKQDNGEIENTAYLVDTTYRQFFLRNEVTNCYGEYIKDKRYGGRVAPLAGYWILQMPNGKEFAAELLSKGFIELTEENAKIYGDSFTLEGIERKDHTKVPSRRELITGVSGKKYRNNMIKPVAIEEIDFYEGEIEERGLKVETPLMTRQLNIPLPPPNNDQQQHLVYEKGGPNNQLELID